MAVWELSSSAAMSAVCSWRTAPPAGRTAGSRNKSRRAKGRGSGDPFWTVIALSSSTSHPTTASRIGSGVWQAPGGAAAAAARLVPVDAIYYAAAVVTILTWCGRCSAAIASSSGAATFAAAAVRASATFIPASRLWANNYSNTATHNNIKQTSKKAMDTQLQEQNYTQLH